MNVTSDMKTYAIQWTSSVNGRIGTGTLRFEKEEAERLVIELNENYPEIHHEAVIPAPAPAQPATPEPPTLEPSQGPNASET